MRNLLIADRQDITKAGIKFLTSSVREIISTEDISTKKELIDHLIKKPESIIIIDYLLFDFGSVDEMIILSERFPKSDWIIFSESLTDNFLRRIVYEGETLSIVLKSSPQQEIVSSFMYAIKHERFICPRVSNQLLIISRNSKDKSETMLTITEKEVLKAIAMGKTTKEIAAERNLSFHTVTTHRKNIFRKLDVNNVHEATRQAMRAGIVDPTEYYI